MKHSKASLSKLSTLLTTIGGIPAMEVFIKNKELDEMPHGGETLGRILGLLKKLETQIGEDTVADLLDNEKRITKVEFEKVIQLVDQTGRCIPARDLTHKLAPENTNFKLDKFKPNYSTVRDSLIEFFPAKYKFPKLDEFVNRIEETYELIGKNELVKNLLKRPSYPTIVPKTNVGNNYGKVLGHDYLAAVKRAYESAFKADDRKFNNYRAGELAGQVEIVLGTRHDQLVKMIAKEWMVGIVFANPLQGFPVLADREQIQYMPESFLLGGGLDFCSALVGYRDKLAKDFTPGYNLSALFWSGRSPYFEAYDDELSFASGARLDCPCGHSSGALFCLAPGSAIKS